MNGQIEAVCESVFSETSQAVDALDLPGAGCFRMRSHSYVRAIEKGCSQEEEEERATRQAISPPRSTTTVRTIQNSTGTSTLKPGKITRPTIIVGLGGRGGVSLEVVWNNILF